MPLKIAGLSVTIIYRGRRAIWKNFVLKNWDFARKSANPIYNELESKAHTAYEAEKLFYACIEQGDTERLSYTMDEFFSNGLVIGKLSENNLRQMQYWAVSCITLAIRYAIEGGLCESEAYEMSDKMIRRVDSMTSSESIPPFLQEKAIELTNLVRYSSIGKDYPPPVRKCISYIKENLEKAYARRAFKGVLFVTGLSFRVV